MFTHEDQTNMFTDHVLFQGANSKMISCNTNTLITYTYWTPYSIDRMFQLGPKL